MMDYLLESLQFAQGRNMAFRAVWAARFKTQEDHGTLQLPQWAPALVLFCRLGCVQRVFFFPGANLCDQRGLTSRWLHAGSKPCS